MNDKPRKGTKCDGSAKRSQCRAERDGEEISADSIVRADLQSRMIYIFGEITPSVHLAMLDCLNRFSELESERNLENVTVCINSQGGNLTSALAIYDLFTSGLYPFKIVTVAAGQAFSAALVIFQGGHERKMFRHAKLLLHRPRFTFARKDSLDRNDLKYEDEMLQEFEKEICELLAEKTGKKIAAIYKDMATEKIFTAQEAIDYGLADEII